MSKFMRVMNKFPALLLRSPLHALVSKSTLLITFTGRKSGKKYTTPITVLLPRRWIVERSFAWESRFRGLAKTPSGCPRR